MKFYRIGAIFFISLFFFAFNSYGQNCCDPDEKLVICYLPSDEYCVDDCRYNYDALFMQGLRQKLNNVSNYGPNGISPCEIEEIPLRNISTAAQLTALNCDIVFLGVTSPQLDINNSIFTTILPLSFTNAVREWSIECIENLTVLFQGETTRWGYEIENANLNPNTPGAVSTPNIFNGVFGMITEVNQGGSFQANFSTLPATGATILAQDVQGRPTIVLDIATNDILMSDVGLVCNGAGDVTVSPNVQNNNDIFACNVFALGCEIASAITKELAIICDDSDYELPDGLIVNQEGEYTSTILSSEGCDSIITTTIEFALVPPLTITYDGCEDDGYEIQVGNGIYNQSNPTGMETLSSSLGCDSLVTISLVFKENSESVFDTIICPNDSFQYLGTVFSEAVDTIIIIPNAINCDSFVTVVVNLYEFLDIEIDTTPIEIYNDEPFMFNTAIPNTYDITWTPESGLSCIDCGTPILNNLDNIPSYNLSIVSEDGCEQSFNFDFSYTCEPYIPNIFNPESINGNDNFGPLVPCNLIDYNLVIYDRWGSLVFETNDQQTLWDGRFKNKKLTPGVFVYSCQYADANNDIVQKSGTLTLIR